MVGGGGPEGRKITKVKCNTTLGPKESDCGFTIRGGPGVLYRVSMVGRDKRVFYSWPLEGTPVVDYFNPLNSMAKDLQMVGFHFRPPWAMFEKIG